MYKNLAPICLFTYNRLEETKLTIASLQKKVHTEKQFNKQVAFNKALRNKLQEKENLERGAI